MLERPPGSGLGVAAKFPGLSRDGIIGFEDEMVLHSLTESICDCCDGCMEEEEDG